MGRLGIHSFVWTGGGTQAMLEEAMEKSAACGYRLIEFAYLRPEKFNLDQLAQRAKSLDLQIAVTMGLPLAADVSSEDAAVVKAGEAMLADAVKAVRDIGGTKLGGILYSAHTKYSRMPSETGRKHSIEAIARTADVARAAGVDLVLEVVNRFETNLLNTTAQGLAFIEATGSEHVRLHLDTFHMNIEENSFAEAIRTVGPLLGHFHTGENNRRVPGKGFLPWHEIGGALREIGYDGAVVMEPFVKMGGGVGADIKVWRDLSEGADEAALDEAARQSLAFSRFVMG